MHVRILMLACVLALGVAGCGDSGPNSGSRCDIDDIEDDRSECLEDCFDDCLGDECNALVQECTDECNGCGEGLECSSGGFCVPYP